MFTCVYVSVGFVRDLFICDAMRKFLLVTEFITADVECGFSGKRIELAKDELNHV